MHFNWFQYAFGQIYLRRLLVVWVFFSANSFAGVPSGSALIEWQSETIVCHSILEPSGLWTAPQDLYGHRDGKQVKLEVIPRAIHSVSLIVPVFRELANGNLMRLLNNLQNQKTDLSEVTLVLVVNNSVAIARENTNLIWIENLATIKWLRKISKNYRFRIQIEDHARTGVEKNMGRIRNLGIWAALREAKSPPEEHLMVHLDADTTLPPDYLAKLRAYYQTYPLDAVYTMQKYLVRDAQNVDLVRTHYRYVFDMNFYHYDRVIQYARHSAGTPQITHMATALSHVGGFPELTMNEDFAMAEKLSQLTYVYAPDISNEVEDRARLDGFDSDQRFWWIKQLRQNENILNPTDGTFLWHWLGAELYRQDAKVANGKISPTEAMYNFDKFLARFCNNRLVDGTHDADVVDKLSDYLDEKPFCALSFAYNWFEPGYLENGLHYWAARLVMLLSAMPSSESSYFVNRWLVEINRHEIAVEARQKAIRRWLEASGPIPATTKDPFLTLLASPTSAVASDILKTYKQALSSTESDELALQAVHLRYADWLLMFDSTPFKKDVVSQEILMEALLLLQNQPERFPELAKMWLQLKP